MSLDFAIRLSCCFSTSASHQVYLCDPQKPINQEWHLVDLSAMIAPAVISYTINVYFLFLTFKGKDTLEEI